MMDDDWELTASCSAVRTLVLVGRTGNGKSATGNTILGKKEFNSTASSSGVTSTCQSQTKVLPDGTILNIIDTPGLFDFSAGSEVIGKEIVKCIDLAKGAIHAVLVVFSVKTRFSREEEASLQSLQNFFGEKITNYMIAIFTGGDDLEDDGVTLDDYLGRKCPEPLQKFLQTCRNRKVLFDNRSKDQRKKDEQVRQLLCFVNEVIDENGGQPYSHELFQVLQKGAKQLENNSQEDESLEGYSKKEITEFKRQVMQSQEKQLRRITEMVEMRLRETTKWLEQKLAEEHAARLNAEKGAQEALEASNEEIRRLQESLERATKETEELRMKAQNGKCAIL